MNIRIGTRGSQLALWQAHYVADRLRQGGLTTEIITISTKGDQRQEVSIAEIGTQGVFTQEIEAQLLARTIDIAVHSAKDLPSELPDPFEIIAFTERERPTDVLLSHKNLPDLTSASDWVVGTSSARRRALLNHHYPALRTVDMRGNLQTRVAKMQAGHCDALMLAYAGVHRMKYDEMIRHEFPLEQVTPPVGQGCIAVEVLRTLKEEKRALVHQCINHATTALQLRTERAFLRTLRGGCSIPVFAHAEVADDRLRIRGGVVSLNGQHLVMDQLEGSEATAEALGEQLAQRVLQQGGKQILDEIRA